MVHNPKNPTGLVYYGLRYYNPETGRFVNRDPIGLSGGTTSMPLWAIIL
ncbi:MAG: hypothetical protein JXR56_03060 [Candidatus Cloacimonetes bacterium]|nr:hypothetical protein [Candidatus Cloacimonadota bacterium]